MHRRFVSLYISVVTGFRELARASSLVEKALMAPIHAKDYGHASKICQFAFFYRERAQRSCTQKLLCSQSAKKIRSASSLAVPTHTAARQ
jgi:hypothetical protein